MDIRNKIFHIRDISDYRSELMGWSIIWIMMLHFTFNQVKPLGFIAQYGFAGVDIFMLVSGFGLYYSLEKDSCLPNFYKKRLLRIFPAYYLIGIIHSVFFYHDDLLTYLYRFSTIDYWIGDTVGDWFVPTIVMYYLFTPFVKKIFNCRWQNIASIIGLITLVVIALAWYFADKPHLLSRLHFFSLFRIASFLFGITCAYWLKKGISERYYFIILIAGIPFFIYLFPNHHQVYHYKYLSLLFLLPLFTICFVLLSRLFKKTSTLLVHIGAASLEIFLIQDFFFKMITSQKLIISEKWHDAITILMMAICVILGIFIHRLIEKSRITHIL